MKRKVGNLAQDKLNFGTETPKKSLSMCLKGFGSVVRKRGFLAFQFTLRFTINEWETLRSCANEKTFYLNFGT